MYEVPKNVGLESDLLRQAGQDQSHAVVFFGHAKGNNALVNTIDGFEGLWNRMQGSYVSDIGLVELYEAALTRI